MNAVVEVSVDEAITLARSAAFEVTDPEASDYGRRLIHSLAGGMGADWDVEAVEDYLRAADVIAWSPHVAGHDLIAQSSERRVVRFDVKSPQVPA